MSEQAFPRRKIVPDGSFLSLCDGAGGCVRMSLRSCFELAAGGDDEWHSRRTGVNSPFAA